MRASYAGRAAGMKAAYDDETISSLPTIRIVWALKTRGKRIVLLSSLAPPGACLAAESLSICPPFAADASADPQRETGRRNKPTISTSSAGRPVERRTNPVPAIATTHAGVVAALSLFSFFSPFLMTH